MTSSNKIQIILGVLSLVGVLGGGVIANWDKLHNHPSSPEKPQPAMPQASPPQQRITGTAQIKSRNSNIQVSGSNNVINNVVQERILNQQTASAPHPPIKKKQLLTALKSNKYEFGWSGNAIGTIDSKFIYYVINTVDLQSDGMAILKYSRPGGGDIQAVVSDRKLTGTWRDADGTGELELTFDDSFTRAEGWWNYGGQTQKYNAFMRRIK